MTFRIDLAALLRLLGAFASIALAQQATEITGISTLPSLSPRDGLPSESHSSTVTLTGSGAVETETADGLPNTTTSGFYTLLVGSNGVPTNTRPCNGYSEFCERKYSNITNVAAHNSPFVRQGNIASNQNLPVTIQLNDGVRGLQFQTHLVDGTFRLCHSSCDLLDVGTLDDYFVNVTEWLRENPYDVLTILLGNGDFAAATEFIAPLKKSGLLDYVYTPPKIPMALDDWPTLSHFILTGKRVVVFLNYEANQTEVPYILDQFSQMWETPFSPTDISFPCDIQRPPGLSEAAAKDRLYLASHNLNTMLSFAGQSLLVPNTVLLNETNAVEGFGSVGKAGIDCADKWGRPPNFILVDHYNMGPVNGSVFQAAAILNNVTYNGKCCGRLKSASPSKLFSQLSNQVWPVYLVVAMMVTAML
ncbi:uncharacterized protein BDCG_03195 [Blastomyces dermatitidis ER-3]|uniref:PLC-like phosphodiesterase n=1 Tax=Ajellomyces dermatitidis (strain ER-3 / ATCC MYA-2586) TaxID=559297 RepID=A0ABM9YH71_AJEDR|nr:uncharacterized protein BDCG_03195 [Blastomyces dermatitidis ER-3]EEQ88075.1 hypothetical protein BDCG_03195 [Blastomyces dermatitidis ER-3]